MPIYIKTQVEPTPQLIAGILQDFTKTAENQIFPYEKGTFLKLKDDYLAGMGGVPNMPALVMMRGQGSILALIAFHKPDGEVAVSFIADGVVEGLFDLGQPAE